MKEHFGYSEPGTEQHRATDRTRQDRRSRPADQGIVGGDGYVPQTTAQLRSIAGTLEISYDRLLNLVQAAQWGEARD
jgi:hypothetical protein